MGGDLLRDAEGQLRVGWKLLGFGGVFLVLLSVGIWLVPVGNIPAQSAVLLAAALGAGWIMLAGAHDRSPAALGFHLDREAVGECAGGLLLGAGVALAAVGAIAVAGGATWSGDEGTVGQLVVEGAGALAFLALPAAAEEALFRGYPLQVLARAWGREWALVVTSVGFGLLHLANPGLTVVAMLNLMVAGAFLGVVYLRTASLWWATAAHLGWNWAHAYVVDLPVSGLELMDTPLWEGAARGASWLGGGSFGPEGSVMTTAVVVLATGLLWWGPWLRPGRAARQARPLMPLPGGSPDEKSIRNEKGG